MASEVISRLVVVAAVVVVRVKPLVGWSVGCREQPHGWLFGPPMNQRFGRASILQGHPATRAKKTT